MWLFKRELDLLLYSLCCGLEVQEPRNLYFVRGESNGPLKRPNRLHHHSRSAWETSEQLHDLTDSFVKATHPSGVPGELTYNVHVHLSCEPYTALEAPLTEIVLWTLREGASREKVEELLPALMRIVNAIPFSEGMYKAGWGPVSNNDGQFVVMIGWETMEVRVGRMSTKFLSVC